jgi:hypothetical protein
MVTKSALGMAAAARRERILTARAHECDATRCDHGTMPLGGTVW